MMGSSYPHTRTQAHTRTQTHAHTHTPTNERTDARSSVLWLYVCALWWYLQK